MKLTGLIVCRNEYKTRELTPGLEHIAPPTDGVEREDAPSGAAPYAPATSARSRLQIGVAALFHSCLPTTSTHLFYHRIIASSKAARTPSRASTSFSLAASSPHRTTSPPAAHNAPPCPQMQARATMKTSRCESVRAASFQQSSSTAYWSRRAVFQASSV